jgi:hypothetical protein
MRPQGTKVCKRKPYGRLLLVSTNGDRFGHPDAEALARIVKSAEAPQFIFNYVSEENEVWRDPMTISGYKLTTSYPEPDKEGAVLDLAAR